MKGKKYKLLSGIAAVIVCILLGCKKRETVLLTELKEEEEQEITADIPLPTEIPFREETPQPERKLVVHICGAVQNPGVYELPEGSRIYQVIEAAGGFLDEAQQDYLNQAESIRDGSRIYVPTKEEAMEALEKEGQSFITESSVLYESDGEATDGNETNRDGLVNINTASESELCTLAGIGSSKAKSIIAYRTENGNFHKIEDIMNVEGIKDGLFQKIRDSITV